MVIDRLVRREIFLADLYCERTTQCKIDNYFKSDSLILPIIGNAGVGKTMLLAHLARRAATQETVLLLGRDRREDETDLSIALTSRLRETAAQLLGNEGDASRVATALRKSGRQLTVLLDGLNEVPKPLLGALPAWIERTVTWLEETGSRLVVSSRPEFWQIWRELFPRRFIFTEDKFAKTRAWEGIQLGDFSEEEAEKVRERYRLRESLAARDIQHPMMARIYWEIQEEDKEGKLTPISRYRALQRFIEMKCDRIARSLAPNVVRSYVETGLQRVADTMLIRGGFGVGREEFFCLFPEDPSLGNQFV